MRDRCTVHVVLHINYMIQQKNIKNVFTQNNHMTSNMLKLLASLWTRKKVWQIAADVAGTDKVQ